MKKLIPLVMVAGFGTPAFADITHKMTTTTESGGRQNMYPTEVKPYLDESYEGYGPNAEKLNGRLAMLGLVAGFVSYTLSGSLFFGGILGF